MISTLYSNLDGKLIRVLMVFGATILLAGCNKSDDELTSAAIKAVQEELVKDYARNMCDSAKGLARLSSESDVIGSCDSDFKPNAGLTFSDMRVYRHKDSIAVCGTVSGRTDMNRIGATFIYIDKSSNNYVLMQKSRYRTTAANKKTMDLLASTVRAEIEKNCQ